MHSDICDSMNVPSSLDKARYLVTFIDDKSRYVRVAMLKPIGYINSLQNL